jgi:hypothetical protein
MRSKEFYIQEIIKVKELEIPAIDSITLISLAVAFCKRLLAVIRPGTLL